MNTNKQRTKGKKKMENQMCTFLYVYLSVYLRNIDEADDEKTW